MLRGSRRIVFSTQPPRSLPGLLQIASVIRQRFGALNLLRLWNPQTRERVLQKRPTTSSLPSEASASSAILLPRLPYGLNRVINARGIRSRNYYPPAGRPNSCRRDVHKFSPNAPTDWAVAGSRAIRPLPIGRRETPVRLIRMPSGRMHQMCFETIGSRYGPQRKNLARRFLPRLHLAIRDVWSSRQGCDSARG